MKEFFDKKIIKKAFNKAAEHYEHAAVLQQHMATLLVERLEFVKLNPKVMLDIGSGTGYCGALLKKKFPEAQLINVDLSEAMLRYAKEHKLSNEADLFINADTELLPLKEHSANLIVSNFVLHWCESLTKVLKEWGRVLKPNSLCIFTTVGIETFKELRESWDNESNPHIHPFWDMHDLGDALIQTGFSDPVIDVENFQLEYNSLESLFKDLKQIGSTNAMHDRSRGLMTPRQWKKLQEHYEKFRTPEGQWPLTYQIIFGHAWTPNLVRKEKDSTENVFSGISIQEKFSEK